MRNSEQLFNGLADIGVCSTGQRYMHGQNRDLSFLIKIWKRWPEYLIEHSGEAIGLLRKHLSAKDIHTLFQDDIFLDQQYFEKNVETDATCFAVGRAKGVINIPDWGVAKIYTFNDSKVTIHCGDQSIVNIECYDSSSVNITGSGRVIVHQYDKSLVFGNANIIKENIDRGLVFNGKEIEE